MGGRKGVERLRRQGRALEGEGRGDAVYCACHARRGPQDNSGLRVAGHAGVGGQDMGEPRGREGHFGFEVRRCGRLGIYALRGEDNEDAASFPEDTVVLSLRACEPKPRAKRGAEILRSLRSLRMTGKYASDSCKKSESWKPRF